MTLREVAYAKVNLALHVRARMTDGYHRIETLFAFCEDGDVVEAELAQALTLHVDGPFAEGLDAGEDNLVLRAARALAQEAGTSRGASIRLDKRLPIAAGVGGGSADAAAALRLLVRLWKLDVGEDRLLALAAGLGADVPACLRSRTVRGVGRGDQLAPVRADGHAGVPILLVNPGVPMPTGPVFAQWDGVDRGPLPADPIAARNDLEAPALALAPAVGEVLAVLRDVPGTTLVRMSGSGATCFALFASSDARDDADARIARQAPAWWRMRSQLR